MGGNDTSRVHARDSRSWLIATMNHEFDPSFECLSF
jgi:hypothetical protein